ncbi:hypothetical protein I3843_12G070800 [Carya illinoinensis]|uniref:Protein PAM68, chloroplastic n=1 Tax=Carya illinoinensis TaxID=32201 RepID=A0A8T1NTM5_CARIL|nr:protein PAM68, chloroplastic-like [Carya illinoinensis]KAG2676791.1 hypothetical protein I3760_12G068900 [Carya illinoinensis]KAG6633765.1 hypothetical protein CIPAW_12G071300 [Carya illinoinensis]KAG6684575.1 hypothetical protein I3842_12G069700 [Carya illinoinensis]KAG7952671.1 hypothetical protein I3843_12G070800 [Carya illinoinensis]
MAVVPEATSSTFKLSLTPKFNPKSYHKIERKICILPIPNFLPKLNQNRAQLSRPTVSLFATLRGPRGFGPSSRKTKKTKKPKRDNDSDEEEEEEEEDEGPDQGVIPEVVTNRMMSRMGFSVGIPLFMGILFFPFFYYLKVGLKIDVPTWVPFIVSFFFFGSALLGVSYGIVSSSWDPMREGSLLGWNEAQKNWPVFWQSIWGRSRRE